MEHGTPAPGDDAPAGPAPGHPGRILRNSAWNMAAQGLYGIFHLAVVFTLARALGKELLGRYYTLYALVLIVQLVAEAGVGTLLTRRIVQAPGPWRRTAA